mmetsp:Transcript_71012/g.148539  ORF Transcript_71012/g.148539 Transcript_71012/m.148539 type:complete len:246 (-) Transcript_71012:1588-2325(-)
MFIRPPLHSRQTVELLLAALEGFSSFHQHFARLLLDQLHDDDVDHTLNLAGSRLGQSAFASRQLLREVFQALVGASTPFAGIDAVLAQELCQLLFIQADGRGDERGEVGFAGLQHDALAVALLVREPGEAPGAFLEVVRASSDLFHHRFTDILQLADEHLLAVDRLDSRVLWQVGGFLGVLHISAPSDLDIGRREHLPCDTVRGLPEALLGQLCTLYKRSPRPRAAHGETLVEIHEDAPSAVGTL